MTGIDYGMGVTNVDHANGIRYGVISQNSVLQAWADSSEPDYGEPICPKCGNAAVSFDKLATGDELESWERAKGACDDFACVNCEYVFDSQDAFGDEPQSWNYVGDGYECSSAFDNTEIFITKSPFYMLADFCSPCAPGAGNVDSPADDGVKTYCFGHDWFEEGKAPYRVFSVTTGEEVLPS